MNLEQTLHARWSADATLAALLPAARLFTGTAPPNTPHPYASLTQLSTKPHTHTSASQLSTAQLAITLWHHDLDALQAIAAAAHAALHRSHFPLDTGHVRLLVVADIAQTEHTKPSPNHTTWSATLTLHALVEHP